MDSTRSEGFAAAAATLCSLAVAPINRTQSLRGTSKKGWSGLDLLTTDIALAGSAPAASPPPPSPPRPVSVVVGAGPAGILTAVYLARRGHDVHVYDRLPSPLLVDSSDEHRAFVVMLRNRGARALAAAGFDVPGFVQQPGSGLQAVQAIVAGSGSQLEKMRVEFKEPQLVGPRQAFVAAMLAQAQQLHPRNLTFHWETSFESLDLQSKTATFRSAASSAGSGAASSTPTSTQQYDLLVAADGGWSRVRRAAEQQLAGQLSSTIEQVPGRYKVYRGLPPSPSAPMTYSSNAASSSTGCSTAGSGMAQLRVLLPSGGGGKQQPGAALFIGTDPADGTARGIVACNEPGWAGLQTAADYQTFLASNFPVLPAEWVPEMAAQLAAGPLAVAGMRVHASQLHGPSLLLVGDAGHGVTPRTGNGMNAALEDAWCVDQLLGERHGDLSTLPERFTAARLADAQALVWLDATTPERSGQSGWGKLHPAVVTAIGRTLLSKATGGWVRPAAMTLINDGYTPYAEAKALIQRDSAVLAAGAAMAAAAAVVMLACSRR